MGKNRLALHWVTILVIVLFAFLAISSGASIPKTLKPVGEETIVSSVTGSSGVVQDMPSPSPSAGKQFDVLDLVFATSVSVYDEKGLEISSQEGIITQLLREAKKLGGNDILNLRIDKNETIIQTKIINEGNSGSSTKTTSSTSVKTTSTKTITTKRITYTGSALAIKYRN